MVWRNHRDKTDDGQRTMQRMEAKPFRVSCHSKSSKRTNVPSHGTLERELPEDHKMSGMEMKSTSAKILSPRPVSIKVAMVLLGAAWLLRLYLWSLGADWKEAATYTSLAYCGPFSVFLLWLTYRGSRWGR